MASEEVDSLTDPGDVYWPVTDHTGTIRDVGRLDDVSGDFLITSHRVYSSFGLLTDEYDPATGTASGVDLEYGFTARFTDPLTGMTHHQFRWYDPQLGKWISEDPLGLAAGDINTTRYVANAPLTYTDPTGLIAISNGNDDSGNNRPSKKPKDTPRGTREINKHPETKDDVHKIKRRLKVDGTGVGPNSWVGITPDREIVVSDFDGKSEILGSLDGYLPAVATEPGILIRAQIIVTGARAASIYYWTETKEGWSEYWRKREIRHKVQDLFDSGYFDGPRTDGGPLYPIPTRPLPGARPTGGRVPAGAAGGVRVPLRLPLPGGIN